ncbi:proline-rich protein 5-like [Lycaon pictus]
MTRGFAPGPPTEFHEMGSFRRPRPRFMSSPVLSDLPRFQAARQALQLSSNSAWNSVQTAVINVFKGGGLQSNELYALNENIRNECSEARFPETRDELSAAGPGQETHIFLLSPTTLLLFLSGGRRRGGNPRDFQGKRRFQETVLDL